MRARIAAFLCLVAASDRGGKGPGAGWSRIEPAAFAQELAAILAARGFPRVRNLAGGMKRWREPVESGP